MTLARAAALVALVLGACDDPLVDLGGDDHDLGLVAGPGATCFLSTTHAELRCLGRADHGQLARDPSTLSERCGAAPCTTTVRTGGLVSAGPMVFGLDFACSATEDDTLCFGDARFGQIGGGARDDAPHFTPRSIGVAHAPLVVVAGRAHACVLAADHTVWCWGDGSHGQLGRDPATLDDCGVVATDADAARLALPQGATARCSATPVAIAGIRDASGLWAGGWGTCLRDGDGDLRCVGRASGGALPVDGPDRDLAVPARSTAAIADAVELALAPQHGCARDAAGAVRCFGDDHDGEAGARLPRPALAIAVGDRATYALLDDHTVVAFGADEHGQLGDGASAHDTCDGAPCARAPVTVALPRHAVSVKAGATHACALLSDDRVACWGDGSDGAIGDALLEDAATPRIVEDLATDLATP